MTDADRLNIIIPLLVQLEVVQSGRWVTKRATNKPLLLPPLDRTLLS